MICHVHVTDFLVGLSAVSSSRICRQIKTGTLFVTTG